MKTAIKVALSKYVYFAWYRGTETTGADASLPYACGACVGSTIPFAII